MSAKRVALILWSIVGLIGLFAGMVALVNVIAGPDESPDELREPTEVSIPPPASHLADALSGPRVLTVASGGPTVRVEIEQKVSHGELRRIAQDMRARWHDGQGAFAAARGNREWRTHQLRFATTFVFFYLPGMNFERDNAWARVEIPPTGTAEVTIISPER